MSTPTNEQRADDLREMVQGVREEIEVGSHREDSLLDVVEGLAWALSRIEELAEKARKYDAINTPELYDFITATVNEALHQREKWGVEGDGGKTDADWFWLIGYLAGKALHNPPKDDMGSVDARLHRIITVAAAACNWHGATLGTYALMRPGIEPSASPSQSAVENSAASSSGADTP